MDREFRVRDSNGDTRSVVLADNGDETFSIAASPAPVDTATVTSVNSSASSQQLLAANLTRRGLIVINTDANACLLKYGTTASATSYTVRIPTNTGWEMPQPIYRGRIDVIWEADGAGALIATEL